MARLPRPRLPNRVSQTANSPVASGQAFAGLAELTQVAMDVVRPAAVEQSKVRGGNRVYRDETGELKIDPANPYGGEMAQIENAAAYASYTSQRKMDMRSTFTELAAQHEFDPAGFQAAAEEYVASLGSDEDVPELLRQDIIQTARNEASQRFDGLSVAAGRRTQRNADRDTAAQRDMLVDDYVNLMMSGETERAAEAYAEIESITAFRASAPYISETSKEGEALLEGARGAARAAEITKRLEDLSGARSITDEEREEIQGLVDNPDLSPAVRQRLYAATQGRLKAIDGRSLADSLAGTTAADAVRNYQVRQGLTSATTLDLIRDKEGFSATAYNDPETDQRGRQVGPNIYRAGYGSDTITRADGTIERVTRDTVVTRADAERDLARRSEEFAADAAKKIGPAWDAMTEQQRAVMTSLAYNYGSVPTRVTRVIKAGGDVAAAIRGLGGDNGGINRNRRNREAALYDGSSARNANPELNRSLLLDRGVPVSPGSEFVAGAFSIDVAAALFAEGLDIQVDAATVLPEAALDLDPRLGNMTVEQARAWANRQGTVKASDIAARHSELDQIEDDEVRAIALDALNVHYQHQRRLEDLAAQEYEDRLSRSDTSLTEQEIRQDHSLSDQHQANLVERLGRVRSDQIAHQETVANLNRDDFQWDIFDSTQMKAVGDVFDQMLGEEFPLSPAGIRLAEEFTDRVGRAPKRTFSAIRSALSSSDPQIVADALDFAEGLTRRYPGAFSGHSGEKAVMSAVDEYRHDTQLLGSQEAADRLIQRNLPENRVRQRNLSDLAKEASRNLSQRDITSYMADLGVEVTLGSDAQAASIMSSYQRLFRDAFHDTADEERAKVRALGEMARIYGPNTISGNNRLMRHPPQLSYPPVNGGHDWMIEQLVADVTAYEFGDDLPDQPAPDRFFGQQFMTGDALRGRIDPSRIILTSDQRTAQDVAANRRVTYSVSYLDDDDVLQVVPGRYEFVVPSPAELDLSALNEGRELEVERTNLRLWREHLRNDPNKTMSLGEINEELRRNRQQYVAAPPG